MTELIVISFESEPDAEAAYKKVLNLQKDLVVELAGLALVKVERVREEARRDAAQRSTSAGTSGREPSSAPSSGCCSSSRSSDSRSAARSVPSSPISTSHR